MKNICPRLFRRNHTYYVRIAVPKKIQSLVKKKELMYSLRTNYYYEALRLLREQSYLADEYNV